jgi:hypothetical protein
MDRPRTHGLALFLAAFPLVGSALAALIGFVWGLGLQCDESCTGDGWRHTAGAPQWAVLTILGFVVFGCGIALFAFVYRSRPWAALTALLLGGATAFGALAWWERGSLSHVDRHPLTAGAVGVLFVSGVLAAFLSAPSEGLRDRTD